MIGYNEIAEVTRYLDAASEEGRDFEDLMHERGINTEALVLAAKQRALRIGMLMEGRDPRALPRDRMTTIKLAPETEDMLPQLQLAYMDGFIAGRSVTDPSERIQRFPQPEN